MNDPIHLPFKDGKGGVDIGLRPIEESSWLEIDHLFSEEIALKEKLYLEKKDQVLVTSPNSQDIQKEVLNLVLGCLLYTSPSPRDKSSSRMPSSA